MSLVLVEKDSSTTILTFHRPEVYNALDKEMLQELIEAVESAHLSRVIIITGSGDKAFCAGADIKKIAVMKSAECAEFSALGQKVTNLLENSTAITIAAVNGLALGGGLEMALACDFIFAAPKIKMGLPEVSLGLIPGFGGTQRLARTLGVREALWWILSAQTFTTEEALAMRLIQGSFPKESLLSSCKHIAQQLAELPVSAQFHAKRAILSSFEISPAAGYALENKLFQECFENTENHARLKQFLQQRKSKESSP